MHCNIKDSLNNTDKGNLIYEPVFNTEAVLTIIVSPTNLSRRAVKLCEDRKEAIDQPIKKKYDLEKRYLENLKCTITNEHNLQREITIDKSSTLNSKQSFDIYEEFQNNKEIYINNKETEYDAKLFELQMKAVKKLDQLSLHKKQVHRKKAIEVGQLEMAYEKEISEEQNNLLENHRRRAKLQDDKKVNANLEIRQRKNHEMYKSNLEEEFRNLYSLTTSLLIKDNFINKDYTNQFYNSLQTISHNMMELRKIVDLTLIREENINMAKLIISEIHALIDESNLIKEADKNLREEMERKNEEMLMAIKKEQQIIEDNKNNVVQKQLETMDDTSNQNAVFHEFQNNSQLNKLTSEYINRQEKLKEVEKICDVFSQNQQMKQYRFRLQRFIGESLNIVDENSWQRTLEKLSGLLNGRTMQLSDQSTISTTQHEHATLFSFNLIAKKIVINGGETISSKASSASKFSVLLIALWSQFDIIGQLFLAHLQNKCPLCIPHYIAREGRTDQEFYRALGYSIDQSGTVEDETNFLKRLQGYITLYSTVIITPHPAHPHSLSHAWIFISRILNQPPHPSYTAAMLYHFLVVVHKDMMKSYNKQYVKLLRFIDGVYMPRLASVMKDACNSYFARLHTFLEEALKTNNYSNFKIF